MEKLRLGYQNYVTEVRGRMATRTSECFFHQILVLHFDLKTGSDEIEDIVTRLKKLEQNVHRTRKHQKHGKLRQWKIVCMGQNAALTEIHEISAKHLLRDYKKLAAFSSHDEG